MRPTVIEHNVETNEVVEREMNDKEFKVWQVEAEKLQSELDRAKAEQEAKFIARESALAKLAALGLTEAEIQALAG
jgi:helix-turn-helix protein